METITHYIIKIKQDDTVDDLIYNLKILDEKSYDGSKNLYIASNELKIFDVKEKEFNEIMK